MLSLIISLLPVVTSSILARYEAQFLPASSKHLHATPLKLQRTPTYYLKRASAMRSRNPYFWDKG